MAELNQRTISNDELFSLLKRLAVLRSSMDRYLHQDAILVSGRRTNELHDQALHARDSFRAIDEILGRLIDDVDDGTVVISEESDAAVAKHLSVIEDCVDVMKACFIRDAKDVKPH